MGCYISGARGVPQGELDIRKGQGAVLHHYCSGGGWCECSVVEGTMREALAGLYQPWDTLWFQGFKVGCASVGNSNGLRLSGPVHPGSSNLQKSEINLNSESQGLILFLVNFLSYMKVMFDNYMHQVIVQTVKIKLLLMTIKFHNETQFKQ